MENQHRKITGYRELSQEEIDLMNEIKAAGEALRPLLNKIKAHVAAQRYAATVDAEQGDSYEKDRMDAADPEMWADWAYCTAQNALMYATRAVAQPTSF